MMLNAKKKLRIGISLRVTNAPNYNEKRDSLSQDWPKFLESSNLIPIYIPNTLENVFSFLENIQINGLILSGGDNIGDNPERDKTEKKIINFGIEHNIPIFGVCRGMQLINSYFGGSIQKTTDSQHVGKKHLIEILNPILSTMLNTKLIEVNSYHYNIISDDTIGNNLEKFAVCSNDKTIEGFFHKELPILGVMWHPEREPSTASYLIVKNALYNPFYLKSKL